MSAMRVSRQLTPLVLSRRSGHGSAISISHELQARGCPAELTSQALPIIKSTGNRVANQEPTEVGSQTTRSPHTHTMARIIVTEITDHCIRLVEVYPIENGIRTVNRHSGSYADFDSEKRRIR